MWRHRFITDSWSWEVPGGEIDEGEAPEKAAARETLEETGWRPGPLRLLGTCHPMPGRIEQRFHAFVADGATREGEPSDPAEAARIEWIAVDRLRELIRAGDVNEGFSLVSLLLALETGAIR
jgi:8-oxo-dGTP pyrophosphatase MutT (NUDIX family)